MITITDWAVVRTVPKIKEMVELLSDRNTIHPKWEAGGTCAFFGSETLWPLMVRVPEFCKESTDTTPLDVEIALEHLRGRLAFLIEKCDDERGLSAPKALDQVNMLLWLLGRQDLALPGGTFEETATAARELDKVIPNA